MIDLGTTEFRFEAPSIAQSELKALTTQLFDDWERYIHGSLALPDYSLFLEVEEGSIRGGGAIAALLGAVYLGIGNYGDFVSGLKTIGEQLKSASGFLAEHAPQVFDCRGVETKVRRRGGTISAIQTLFVKVQRGELTADEAMVQAENILGEDAANSSSFMDALAVSLRTCPRFHEQISLPLDELSEIQPMLPGEDTPRPKKPAHQTPVIAPLMHFRIEVWRDSKNKRRRSRVVQL